jgi:hypothetical protein
MSMFADELFLDFRLYFLTFIGICMYLDVRNTVILHYIAISESNRVSHVN